MKRTLVIVAMGAMTTFLAYGSPCAQIINPTTDPAGTLVNNQTVTDSTDTCTLADGQTFSNFAVYGNAGFLVATPFNVSVTVVNGNTLQFGTTNMGGTGEDIQVTFQSSPGLGNVILTTGPNDSVTEVVCGTPVPTSEVCGSGNLNNSPLVSFNGSASASTIKPASTDYFLKNDSGGSSFSQAFIPEPMTLSLMGGGLLGLGLLRRRMRK